MTTSTTIDVQGFCEPRFAAVREAFERNFAEYGDTGAAVAVTLDGAPVVDLWAGLAVREPARPWERDTLVNVYSTTKGIVATCAHMLADRGLLDYDAPVVEYWPEFGKHGKERIPVRWLLTHQAGLPAVDGELTPGMALDWKAMVRALEETTPAWIPGTKNGYHTATFGWLVGEVIRRVSGAASVGAFVRDEIAGPLGIDFYIGTPESEDGRIAELVRPGADSPAASDTLPGMARPLTQRSFLAPLDVTAAHPNSREWRAAEIPAANGHSSARALARIYGALSRGGEVDGVRLMTPERVEIARRMVTDNASDETLGIRTRRSLGFFLPIAELGDKRGPQAFGHAGMGGSIGWADPQHRIGFGYVMAKMWDRGYSNPDPRANGLAGAVYRSLGV